MSVRPLQPSDIPSLSAAVAELPLMQRYQRTADGIAQSFLGALSRGESILVFDDGVHVQGFAWFLPTGTFALGGYLRLIAVAPGNNRKGIGAALLAAY